MAFASHSHSSSSSSAAAAAAASLLLQDNNHFDSHNNNITIPDDDTSKQKPRRPAISSTRIKQWLFLLRRISSSCCLLLLVLLSLGWLAGFGATELDFANSVMHSEAITSLSSSSYSYSSSLSAAAAEVVGNHVHQVNPVTGKPRLDFLVGGFPKCGTTTLLFAFQKHTGISIGERENCLLARPIQQDDVNMRELDKSLAQLDDSTASSSSSSSSSSSVAVSDKLLGMKCPDTLGNFKTIHRLAQHSPQCKFVIGVRHPVQMLQSFYNYRVTEIYDKHLTDPIPDLLDVLSKHQGAVPWKDVSLDSGRFELKLLQFAKTNMTVSDMNMLLDRPHYAVKPNRFKIFLYALEQINDNDNDNDSADRSAEFRQDLQGFLELPTPIPSFGHENLNRFVGSKAHGETVNICDAHFDKIRTTLVENSRKTAVWIRDQFIMSPDVVVSNRAYFIKILEDWMKDPCREKPAAAAAATTTTNNYRGR
jgi:hypothetical protein